MAVTATFAIGLGACFRPIYVDGSLACDDTADDACPAGYVCGLDKHCWLPGSGPSPHSSDAGDGASVGEVDAPSGSPGDGRQTTDAGNPATGGDAAASVRDRNGGAIGGEDVQSGMPPDAGNAGERPEGTDADGDNRTQLSSLVFSSGALSPAFGPTTTSYDLLLPLKVTSVTVTATLAQPAPGTVITINNLAPQAGIATANIMGPVGVQPIYVRVDAAGGAARTYTITSIRGGLVTYFKASNTDKDDAYGTAVAMASDLIVVGAPEESSGSQLEEDNTAKSAGAVYVYGRLGAGWAQQAYLKASLPRAGDRFGRAVAVSPSGSTIAVGAPGQDSGAMGPGGVEDSSGAADSGAVYVFVRAGNVWTLQAFLKPSNTGAGDTFGSAVALGNDTLLVGAPEEDSNADGINGNDKDNTANDAGAAYMFTRVNNAWSQTAYIKASNSHAGDRFGERVAVSNDLMAISAPAEDSNAKGVGGDQTNSGAPDSGAVYTFTRQAMSVAFQAYIKASNTGANDHFGTGIALFGDVLAVGAPQEDSDATGINGNQNSNSANDSGAVYVFKRGGAWSQQAYIKGQVVEAGDHFGEAVAYAGGYLAVGVPDEDSSVTTPNIAAATDNNAKESGALYLFRQTGNAWMQQGFLKAPHAQAGDRFGSALAIFDDAVACGAAGEDSSARSIGGNPQDNSAPNAGAMHLF